MLYTATTAGKNQGA